MSASAGTIELTVEDLAPVESPRCESRHSNPDEPGCTILATHTFRCTGCRDGSVLICQADAEWITWHSMLADAKCIECKVPTPECWVIRPLG